MLLVMQSALAQLQQQRTSQMAVPLGHSKWGVAVWRTACSVTTPRPGNEERCDHSLVAAGTSKVHGRPPARRSAGAGVAWEVDNLDRHVWIRTTREQTLRARLVAGLGRVKEPWHSSEHEALSQPLVLLRSAPKHFAERRRRLLLLLLRRRRHVLPRC
jgi:hypothetical protein